MPLSASKLKVGDTHTARLVEDLKRTQIVQYAGASGDYNPLHTDEIFTTQVAGYPSVFAHGMLTMGMTGKMLTDYVGDARLTKYGVRFTSQVWPGDTLDATATVKAITERDGAKIVELDVSTKNEDGVEVLSGYAEARWTLNGAPARAWPRSSRPRCWCSAWARSARRSPISCPGARSTSSGSNNSRRRPTPGALPWARPASPASRWARGGLCAARAALA
jgi:acyl dehydratase